MKIKKSTKPNESRMRWEKSTKIKLWLLLLVPISMICLHAYADNPIWWEKFYSLKINKITIEFLSSSFGILPFSVFEVLVFLLAISLIWYVLVTIYNLIRHFRYFYIVLGRFVLNIVLIAALLFSSFELLWGLNYKRPQFGLGHGLVIGEYTTEQLGALYVHLLKRAETVREFLDEDENGIAQMYGDYQNIFTRAPLGFVALESVFEELGGDYGQAKPIAVSDLLNYASVTGIYSPFTGEPNVNVAIPAIYIPSTTCHEMGHQRGFGFEDQCNFIAFITCERHPHADFQYSGYLLAIAYTSNAIAKADFGQLRSLNQQMSDGVRRDLDYGNAFWDQYQGDIEEMADSVNNTFLKSNGVHSGTANYGKVVELLLAYYAKYFA
ncbi:DUF3810 domain-containing protein [Candidatus Epulonipiscium viviparus]|uniref:DUF3810 domain-containing protein n=1 Tax=Candidatus Epulonipiscium viviparus TaxID=420336 RepID=UPI0027381598|nr:DUF3810 domain-containing protein [Candidatus Epulopiscium viviparus]